MAWGTTGRSVKRQTINRTIPGGTGEEVMKNQRAGMTDMSGSVVIGGAIPRAMRKETAMRGCQRRLEVTMLEERVWTTRTHVAGVVADGREAVPRAPVATGIGMDRLAMEAVAIAQTDNAMRLAMRPAMAIALGTGVREMMGCEGTEKRVQTLPLQGVVAAARGNMMMIGGEMDIVAAVVAANTATTLVKDGGMKKAMLWTGGAVVVTAAGIGKVLRVTIGVVAEGARKGHGTAEGALGKGTRAAMMSRVTAEAVTVRGIGMTRERLPQKEAGIGGTARMVGRRKGVVEGVMRGGDRNRGPDLALDRATDAADET